jgi:hypothetical protein
MPFPQSSVAREPVSNSKSVPCLAAYVLRIKSEKCGPDVYQAHKLVWIISRIMDVTITGNDSEGSLGTDRLMREPLGGQRLSPPFHFRLVRDSRIEYKAIVAIIEAKLRTPLLLSLGPDSLQRLSTKSGAHTAAMVRDYLS